MERAISLVQFLARNRIRKYNHVIEDAWDDIVAGKITIDDLPALYAAYLKGLYHNHSEGNRAQVSKLRRLVRNISE